MSKHGLCLVFGHIERLVVLRHGHNLKVVVGIVVLAHFKILFVLSLDKTILDIRADALYISIEWETLAKTS